MLDLISMIDIPKPMMPDFKATGPTQFLKEVKGELVKVTWPTRDEVVKLTIIVIAVSLVVGLYIGGLDFVMTKVTDVLIKR